MDDITSGALVSDPETRRALQLDALSAILPMERRDRLAELLTDDDVETLKHLAREGMGENTLRALASDLAYLEGWAKAATGSPLAVAGAGKPGAEIRGASSVGPGEARDRSAAWHAGRCRHTASRGRGAAQRRAACAFDGEAAARKLGDLASVERAGGPVRCAEPARRAPAGGPRQHPTAAAQEQARPDPRRARSADRDVFVGSACGYARPRHSAAGLRLRRAPSQRSGAAAGRAAQRRAAGGARSARSELADIIVCRDPARAYQDRQRRRRGQGAC